MPWPRSRATSSSVCCTTQPIGYQGSPGSYQVNVTGSPGSSFSSTASTLQPPSLGRCASSQTHRRVRTARIPLRAVGEPYLRAAPNLVPLLDLLDLGEDPHHRLLVAVELGAAHRGHDDGRGLVERA